MFGQRKEKCRNAARNRRNRENYEFIQLARILPIPFEISSQLDKASIVRLIINLIKLQSFLSNPNMGLGGRENLVSRNYFKLNDGALSLQLINGFLIATCPKLSILYISETVSIYLGLSQIEMIGCYIDEYVHSDDALLIRSKLAVKDEKCICICIRFKSTLTRRLNSNRHANGHRVMQMIFKPLYHFNGEIVGYVGVILTIKPITTYVDYELNSYECVHRVDNRLNVKYGYYNMTQNVKLDKDESDNFGISEQGLDSTNISLYSMCHHQDLSILTHAHMQTLQQFQSITPLYRWVTEKNYLWVKSSFLSISSKYNDNILVLTDII